MDTSNVPWVVEWLWVPLWGAVIFLFRKAFGLETDVAVLKEGQRIRDRQHAETMVAIESHNTSLGSHNDAVLSAVGAITSQIETNGKRIASIEAHLRNGKDS